MNLFSKTKALSALSLAICLLVSATPYANADFTGPQTQGTVKSETVQNVLNSSFHGMKVLLTGKIVQKLSHDKYQFKDSTGEITIDIDQKYLPFNDFTTTDTVMISGEIDMKKRNRRLEIDVKRVEIIKSTR